MFKKIAAFLFILMLTNPVFSQNTEIPQPNKVTGLELPPDQSVKFDEGFVTLQATCEGEVKWLVISVVKVKFFTLPQGNSIVISIPPQGGNITVFAIGLVSGKLTEFARTNILITGNGSENMPDKPVPPQPTKGGPYHVTFIVDLNSNTPELAQILNSQAIDQAIVSKGSYRRVYDIKSPVLREKGLDVVAQQVGGNAILIIQNKSGQIVDKRTIPTTEAEILKVIETVLGGLP